MQHAAKDLVWEFPVTETNADWFPHPSGYKDTVAFLVVVVGCMTLIVVIIVIIVIIRMTN